MLLFHSFCFHHFQPDITAPGVDIIYAFVGATSPTGLAQDNRRIPYNIGSGTSASCPHVSGIVGLLKTLYPSWSPAALKSAIMTTGKVNMLYIRTRLFCFETQETDRKQANSFVKMKTENIFLK